MIHHLLRRISTRLYFGVGFLIAAAVIAVSIFYFQIYLGLMPCTLCELQRVIIMLFGIICFIGFLHGPKGYGARIYSFLLFMISCLGFAVAFHQFSLEGLPLDQLPVCGPGLNYLLTTLPLKSAIVQIFKGSAECFQVQWRFLSVSIAGWSSLFFAGFMLVNLWGMFRLLPGKEYKLFHR